MSLPTVEINDNKRVEFVHVSNALSPLRKFLLLFDLSLYKRYFSKIFFALKLNILQSRIGCIINFLVRQNEMSFY